MRSHSDLSPEQCAGLSRVASTCEVRSECGLLAVQVSEVPRALSYQECLQGCLRRVAQQASQACLGPPSRVSSLCSFPDSS